MARFEVWPVARGEPLQVRGGDLAQLERAEHGEPEVEHADAEPVLAGRLVLVEVAEPGEGRDVAVRGAAGQPQPLGQLADSERGRSGVNVPRMARPRSSDCDEATESSCGMFQILERRIDIWTLHPRLGTCSSRGTARPRHHRSTGMAPHCRPDPTERST